MNVYATTDDMTMLWRAMTPEETQRAEALLPIVSASLRTEAKKVGKNLDEKSGRYRSSNSSIERKTAAVCKTAEENSILCIGYCAEQ